MADVSTFMELISNASRGETVRDSFTNALKTMDRDGISAERLNGYTAAHFVKLSEFNGALLENNFKFEKIYDRVIDRESSRCPESNAVYWTYKRLNDSLEELLGDK